MEVKGSKIQACYPYYNHILLYRKQNTLLTIISKRKAENYWTQALSLCKKWKKKQGK